jgi:hypothetical protein
VVDTMVFEAPMGLEREQALLETQNVQNVGETEWDCTSKAVSDPRASDRER